MKRPSSAVDDRKTARKDSRKETSDQKRQRNAQSSNKDKAKQERTHLPVSSLCGFLGAGKTTLLKHILESKHSEDDAFKCAVIVNDMAEVNIDKALIDQTALIQSDEVIPMQNGCVCCTLQSDLVDQIIGLAKKKCFDYMIIEASGVSEPSQIAQLFANCENHEDHAPEEAHEALNEFARLDTCVTVVDCGDFFSNLTTVKEGPTKESFPQLLVEQIEYANVVILNKTDLVNKAQLQDIQEQVSILNPRARILASQNSKIDVMQVVNTGLYKAEDFEETTQKIEKDQKVEEIWQKPCCLKKTQKGQVACCKPKPRHLDTGMSQVFLCKSAVQTRHETRFGITSFLYQARRPLHPVRFDERVVQRFFVFHTGSGKNLTEEQILQRQKEASQKQKLRSKEMGTLLRSKGFLWIANRHDLRTIYSQAGNVLSIESPERSDDKGHKGVSGSNTVWWGTIDVDVTSPHHSGDVCSLNCNYTGLMLPVSDPKKC